MDYVVVMDRLAVLDPVLVMDHVVVLEPARPSQLHRNPSEGQISQTVLQNSVTFPHPQAASLFVLDL
jgi:hypothetical protein